jgi:hypothetical protein
MVGDEQERDRSQLVLGLREMNRALDNLAEALAHFNSRDNLAQEYRALGGVYNSLKFLTEMVARREIETYK